MIRRITKHCLTLLIFRGVAIEIGCILTRQPLPLFPILSLNPSLSHRLCFFLIEIFKQHFPKLMTSSISSSLRFSSLRFFNAFRITLHISTKIDTLIQADTQKQHIKSSIFSVEEVAFWILPYFYCAHNQKTVFILSVFALRWMHNVNRWLSGTAYVGHWRKKRQNAIQEKKRIHVVGDSISIVVLNILSYSE